MAKSRRLVRAPHDQRAGFIAIVLAMLARRRVWVLLGAILFGVSLSLTTALRSPASTSD